MKQTLSPFPKLTQRWEKSSAESLNISGIIPWSPWAHFSPTWRKWSPAKPQCDVWWLLTILSGRVGRSAGLDLIVCNFECIQILATGKFTTYFWNREEFMNIKLIVEVVITSMYMCFCFNEYWVELMLEEVYWGNSYVTFLYHLQNRGRLTNCCKGHVYLS